MYQKLVQTDCGVRLKRLAQFVALLLATPVLAQLPTQQPLPASVTPMPTPQALGPKAPGRVRIGVAPAQAQLGQGNNSQGDYGTSIRNSIVLVMSGPAVEIVGLDSRIPIQVAAEAQQKQCDYILYAAVEVKHSTGGRFGGIMKKAAPLSNLTPVGMLSHAASMATTQASVAAAQVAAMSAQQQAMNQLAQFNGQVKSKDDVSITYQLFPKGQDKAALESTLKGKAKTDGEDVLTPLIQQTATNVLTEVLKK